MKKIESIVKRYAIKAAESATKRDMRSFAEVVRDMFKEIGETGILQQLSVSLALVFFVVVINSFILAFLVAFGFSPMAAMFVTAVFVLPLTEETGKYLSVKYGVAGMHYIIFNITEFTIYLVRLLGMGVALPVIVLARLISALFHLFLTTLHIRGKTEGREVDRGMLAVVLHFIWNFMAMLPAIGM